MYIYASVKQLLIIIICFTLLSTEGILYIKTVKATSINYPFNPSDEIIQKALGFLRENQKEDGCIGSFSITAWAAMAISAADEDLDKWGNLTVYLEQHISLLQKDRITDWERMVLASVALNENPQDFNGINLVEHIKNYYDGKQIGDPSNLYDDIFGIISLISAGINKNDTIIKNVANYIKEKQGQDGSWGDVDTTSAAIMALTAAGEKSHIIQKALNYIKTRQQDNGGFISWGATNIATTAWAVDAIVATGGDPTSKEWEKNGKTPIDFMLSLQQDDGSFSWSEERHYNPEWMTAYAIPALLGKPYPVKKLPSKGNDNEDNPTNHRGDDSDINESYDKNNRNKPTTSYFITPDDNTLYIFNIKTGIKTLIPIVIGPLTIEIDAPADVNKVVFMIDNKERYTDYTKPFTYSLNTWGFLDKKIITVKEYLYKTNLSHTILYHYIENISILSKKLHDPIVMNRVRENLSKLENSYLRCDPIIIEKEIRYLNLFPNLYRGLKT